MNGTGKIFPIQQIINVGIGSNPRARPAIIPPRSSIIGSIESRNAIISLPKGIDCILYGIKANGPLNSKIHGNAYSRVNNGSVRFLIKEGEAKSALLSTKVGQKMSVEERVKRLMPHEMTSRLFDEIANLRLKKTGNSMDIVLEQINSRYPKDKYSAFAYGLWRIKELEEESFKKKRRRSGGLNRQLIFFSGGA